MFQSDWRVALCSELLRPMLPRIPHLVVAANEVHVPGVLNLQRQQQTDGLQRMRTAVHKVAQELPSGGGRG